MKISSVTMPEKPFQVLRNRNSCTIEFFDNVKSSQTIDGVTGNEISSWNFDKYVMTVPYTANISADIEANFAIWLQKAKNAEIESESEKVRNYRDSLLNTCDTVYCNAERWAAMTADQQKAWTEYKDALRDVPEQDGFPYTVNWPAMPKIDE